MKYFLDTEFFEDDLNRTQLISVGIVREDGKEFYAEDKEVLEPGVITDPWIKKNVLPKLTGPSFTLKQIRRKLIEFTEDDHECQFWAWFVTYDWYVITKLMGGFMSLPPSWNGACYEIDMLLEFGQDFPFQSTPEHHALNDAKYNLEIYNYLTGK